MLKKVCKVLFYAINTHSLIPMYIGQGRSVMLCEYCQFDMFCVICCQCCICVSVHHIYDANPMSINKNTSQKILVEMQTVLIYLYVFFVKVVLDQTLAQDIGHNF